MTDRNSAYIVMLNKDSREDDLAATLIALRQIKGVIDVKPVVADALGAVIKERVRREYKEKLRSIFDD